MGFSQDYPNVPEWEYKDTGYRTEDMVKYEGNIFIADIWAQAYPRKEPLPEEGWALADSHCCSIISGVLMCRVVQAPKALIDVIAILFEL